MRHQKRGRKLNRTAAHRVALRRNLTRSLFREFGGREFIVTTREKAKFVQPFAEKLITLGKEKTLHNYRRGLALLRDEEAVHRLFEEIGPRYASRPGGYTRIVRTGTRRLGDKATQVIFGFVRDAEAEGAEAPEAAAMTE
ncbi:MAG TPA: 50S ribosomal protein L17 [Planctomycetota bacterium]|nr:50S ribosomal protein L17 [Planctomycetota bacterium]